MKKINIKVLSILFAVVTMVGCTGNFEEINKDPNSATVVPTAYLLTNAERGIQTSNFYFTTALYAQHWSETQYTNTSRYETAEASFNGYYTGPLADLQQIITLNTEDETKGSASSSGDNANQIAVATILQVYTFQLITDMWGDIPYSEALAGTENFTPAYDTQDVIYADFLVKLDGAIASINTSPSNALVGDQMYQGDMAMWKKFANALKMRIGGRMLGTSADAAGRAAIAAAIPGAFAAGENALYPFLTDAANDNPMYAHFITRTDYAVSETLVNFMSTRNDPRLPVYGDPAPNFTPAVVGMPYGVDNAVAGAITNDEISFPGAAARAADTPGILMTYAEQKFIEAEYLELTGGAGSGQAAYEAGIQASMDYWGATMGTYLTEPGVAYSAANALQLIGEQKWLALYTDGHEAWANWRRTGFPALVKAPDAVEGREIPRRRAYTQREYDLNGANLDAAILKQGADLMDTRMWWDK
jgi:hypothetical protein